MVARLAAAALLLAACGPDEAEYGFVRTERVEPDPDPGGDEAAEGEGEKPIPDEPLEDWAVEGADPLSGIFAVETTIKARLVIDLEAKLIHRLRLVRRGTEVQQRFTLCDVELPSVPGVAELTIPERLRSLVQSRHIDGVGDFFDSAEAVGATYAPEVPEIALGPEDDDADGNPGVTVSASAIVCDEQVEVYASLVVGAGIRGTVLDDDTMEGEADPTLSQEILGWSDECIQPAAALEIEIVEGSHWRAERVAPEHDLDGNGNVSCPEIIRTRPREEASEEGSDEGT